MRTERQNSMRVLMVSSERTWGGGEAQLELLMKGLLADGLRVHLAAPANSEIRRRVSELNAPFHPVAIENGFDLVSAWRLRSVVKRGRFGVVHSHTSHAHSTSFMACETVPKSQRPFQVVSRRVAAPVATHWLSRAKYQKGADVFLAVSNCVRDVLADGGVPQNKIRLVHDGIDLSKFDRVRENAYVKAEFGIDAGAPVVGNVAALAPYKSQVDIIRAAPIVRDRYPRVKFLIVGEGKLREHLQSLIDEMGLAGTVVLTGFRDDPLEIMSTFACFVLSSYLEGLGTSVMDAQAMGIPVVATDAGGIPDIVEDGVTGLLTPARDPQALARAILRVLDDPHVGQGLAAKALAISRGYDYRHMVYKTLGAYDELAGAIPEGQTR